MTEIQVKKNCTQRSISSQIYKANEVSLTKVNKYMQQTLIKSNLYKRKHEREQGITNNNLNKFAQDSKKLKSSHKSLSSIQSLEKKKSDDTEKFMIDSCSKLKNVHSRNLLISKDISLKKSQMEKSAEQTSCYVEYTKSIKQRWNDFTGTIKLLESAVKHLEENIKNLRKETDLKFEETEIQNKYNIQSLNFEMRNSEGRERKIRELEIREEILRIEFIEQEKSLIQKQEKNECRNKEIVDKINLLYRKCAESNHFIENNDKHKKIEISNIHSKERNTQMLEKRIYEIILKNDLLKQEIKDLTTKFSKPKLKNILIRNKSANNLNYRAK